MRLDGSSASIGWRRLKPCSRAWQGQNGTRPHSEPSSTSRAETLGSTRDHLSMRRDHQQYAETIQQYAEPSSSMKRPSSSMKTIQHGTIAKRPSSSMKRPSSSMKRPSSSTQRTIQQHEETIQRTQRLSLFTDRQRTESANSATHFTYCAYNALKIFGVLGSSSTDAITSTDRAIYGAALK